MNKFLKSIVVYCELLLLSFYSSVALLNFQDDYGSRNSNTIPLIERNNFLSNLFNVSDKTYSREEKSPQVKPDPLFRAGGPIFYELSHYSGILKQQSLLSSASCDYLLSSDLKSPPNN